MLCIGVKLWTQDSQRQSFYYYAINKKSCQPKFIIFIEISKFGAYSGGQGGGGKTLKNWHQWVKRGFYMGEGSLFILTDS